MVVLGWSPKIVLKAKNGVYGLISLPQELACAALNKLVR